MKEFRRLFRAIVEEDLKFTHMPDYSVSLDEDDMVTFRSRGTVPGSTETDTISAPSLKPETYELARHAAPGWDVHLLEQEWRGRITKPPQYTDAAFVGFCRQVFERRSTPYLQSERVF